MTLLLRRILLLVAALGVVAAACGDDDGDGGDAGAGGGGGGDPVAWVEAEDGRFGVGTTGLQYVADTPLPVRLTNDRDEDATFELFLVTPDYEGVGPRPEGVDAVLEESVPAGEEVIVEVTFPEAGDYAAFVSPHPEDRPLVGGIRIPIVDQE